MYFCAKKVKFVKNFFVDKKGCLRPIAKPTYLPGKLKVFSPSSTTNEGWHENPLNHVASYKHRADDGNDHLHHHFLLGGQKAAEAAASGPLFQPPPSTYLKKKEVKHHSIAASQQELNNILEVNVAELHLESVLDKLKKRYANKHIKRVTDFILILFPALAS